MEDAQFSPNAFHEKRSRVITLAVKLIIATIYIELYPKGRMPNGTGKPRRGSPLKTLKLIISKLHYNNNRSKAL